MTTYHDDDERLSAFLDNELDDASREALERELAEQSGHAARLDAFADIDQLLRNSYAQIHDIPLPTIDPEAILMKRSTWQRHVSVPLAAAASVIMLLSGVLVGMVGERMVESDRVIAATPASGSDLALASAALSHELEQRASGDRASFRLTANDATGSIVITCTWRMEDGRYCREYELGRLASQVEEIGVACREDSGEWRIRVRTFPDQKGQML